MVATPGDGRCQKPDTLEVFYLTPIREASLIPHGSPVQPYAQPLRGPAFRPPRRRSRTSGDEAMELWRQTLPDDGDDPLSLGLGMLGLLAAHPRGGGMGESTKMKRVLTGVWS